MQVESAMRRHVPHRFGQHTESYYHKNISIIGGKSFEKCWIAQFLRLQQWQVVLECILFDGTENNLLPATSLPVWHGDHCNNLVA